ncbi:monovalent cation/H+ antiporter complex subunit F [Kineococcus sp. SYSU DK004]|uniref:monovalent cation/H+ antiporter complex subunit F n=1 Tax=Kineococcus sp. SYSU DK004 TaxID=3383125 RepID=UPI003D7D153B
MSPVVVAVAQALLVLAAVLALVRALLGPTALDRTAAVDVFIAALLSGIALAVVRDGSAVFVPVLLVLALLGFASSVAVARFVGRDDR